MNLTANKEENQLLTAYSDTELQLTADVLVIGGGPAAAWAAWAAAAQGVKVIIVDKGFLGTSGAAAASGNSIMAPSPENYEKVVSEHYWEENNLANFRWIERVVEKAWLSLPLVEDWGYRFPKENGKSVRSAKKTEKKWKTALELHTSLWVEGLLKEMEMLMKTKKEEVEC